MQRFLSRLRSNEGPKKSRFRPNNNARLITTTQDELEAEDAGCYIPEGLDEEYDRMYSDDTAEKTTAEAQGRGTSSGHHHSYKAGEGTSVMNLAVVIQAKQGVCNRSVEGLVDSGADRSIISTSLARELDLNIHPDESRLSTADGTEIAVGGKAVIKLALKDMKKSDVHELECLVLDRPGYELLLGMDYFARYDISIHPKQRCVKMGSKKVHCKVVGYLDSRMLQNRFVKDTEKITVGHLTENVENLPVQVDDRILFPANRLYILDRKN